MKSKNYNTYKHKKAHTQQEAVTMARSVKFGIVSTAGVCC